MPLAYVRNRMNMMFLQLGIGMVLGGGVLAWLGFKELRLAGAADATPRTVTCRDLGTLGPGDNAHVRMTDFVLVLDEFAIESRQGVTSWWSKAWVPAVPVDGEYVQRLRSLKEGERVPPPTDFRVLVQLGAGSQLSLDRLEKADAIQGTVINDIDSIDSDVQRILRTSYPGVAVERCWILEEGRLPKSGVGALVMFAGGILLIAGGIGSFFVHRRIVVTAKRSEARAAEVARRRFARRRSQLGPGPPRPPGRA